MLQLMEMMDHIKALPIPRTQILTLCPSGTLLQVFMLMILGLKRTGL
jgi:hypothetical protein